MERTLALLAFDNPEESPFGDLLNMMQRQKVRRWGPCPPHGALTGEGAELGTAEAVTVLDSTLTLSSAGCRSVENPQRLKYYIYGCLCSHGAWFQDPCGCSRPI